MAEQKVSPEDVRRARESISIVRDDERLKFIAIVRGTPMDIPIGFMRFSEAEPLAELFAEALAAYSAAETERLENKLDKAETWLAELDFGFGGVRSAFASVVQQIDNGNIAGARQQAENWRTGFPNTRKAAAEAERDRLKEEIKLLEKRHDYHPEYVEAVRRWDRLRAALEQYDAACTALTDKQLINAQPIMSAIVNGRAALQGDSAGASSREGE